MHFQGCFWHFQNSPNLPNWPKLLSLLDIYCLLRERRTARKAIMNTGGMNKTFLYFTCDSGRLPSGQISRQGDTHNQDRAKAKVLSERKAQTHKWRYLILVLNLNRPQPCVPYAEMDSSPLHPFIQLQYVSICEWFLLVHFISHAWEESLLHHDVLPRLIDAVLCPEGPEMHFIRTWKERCHWAMLCLHWIETNELEIFRHHVHSCSMVRNWRHTKVSTPNDGRLCGLSIYFEGLVWRSNIPSLNEFAFYLCP